MYHRIIKIVIAGLLGVWAGFQFADVHIMNGISILLLAGVFVFFYFKNELLLLAFFHLRKQNMDGAQKWLNKIKKPETALIAKQQGYYFYLQGIQLHLSIYY